MKAGSFNFILCVILFFSCQSNEQSKKKKSFKTIEIGTLSIDVPSDFLVEKKNGIDSYSFHLSNNRDFILQAEISKMSKILFDEPFPVFDISLKSKFQLDTTKGVTAFFSAEPEEDQRFGTFNKNYYMYDTINNIVVKIIQPKKIGNGISGVYISGLSDENKITLYSENLDSNNHTLFMKIIRSLRYSNK